MAKSIKKRLTRYEAKVKAKAMLEKGMGNRDIKAILPISDLKLQKLRAELKEEARVATAKAQEQLALKTSQEEEKARLVAKFEEVEPQLEQVAREMVVLNARSEVLSETAEGLEGAMDRLAKQAERLAYRELVVKEKIVDFTEKAMADGNLAEVAVVMPFWKGK